MHLFHKLFLLAFTILLTATFNDAQAQKASGKSKKSNLTEEQQRNLEKTFIDACSARQLGDMEEAMRLFQKCLDIDKNNHATMFELAKIYREQKNVAQAGEMIEEAVNLNPDNKYYNLFYADLLGLVGRYDEAADVYARLSEREPDNIEYQFQQAALFEMNGKWKEALKIFDQMEATHGVNETWGMEKQRIYLQQGETDKAVEEIEKLLAETPKNAGYYQVLSSIYEMDGQQDKALEMLERMIEIDPENSNAALMVAGFQKRKGNYKKYFELLETAFGDSEVNIDKKIMLLIPYVDSLGKDFKTKDQIFKLNQLMTEAHPNEAKAFAMYADFLYYDDQHDKARAAYIKSIGLNDAIFDVWQKVFFIDADARQYDSLQVRTMQAMEVFPNQPLSYLFNGVAKNQLKNHEEAVKVLKRGLPMTLNNKRLKADFYNNLGDAYHALEQHENSDNSYEKCLDLDPTNAFVLNNYSYYLSLRNVNLERAKEMSEKSNELIPDQASFQDTYAWILFKMGDYKEAKIWLEKALSNGGDNDETVLDHYGDVLFELNDVEGAIQYWKLAKEKGLDAAIIDKKIMQAQSKER